MGAIEESFKISLLIFLIQFTGAVRKFNDLIVKTDAFEEDKSNAFFTVPKSTRSPLIKYYVKVTPEPSFKFKMDFYCRPNDPRFCLMFDKKGYVVGTQISFIKSDINNQIKVEDFDMEKVKEYDHTNFFGIPAYSSRVFFTNPELLTGKGRQGTGEIANGLWTYLNRKVVEIPRQESMEPKIGSFYRQGCYPGLGQYYVYNFHRNASCDGVYALTTTFDEGGSLVSYGISMVSLTSKYQVDWFEKPSWQLIKEMYPYAPACSLKLLKKYSLSALHVFLIYNPQNTTCAKTN